MKTVSRDKLKVGIYYDNRVSGRNDGSPLYYLHVLREQMGLKVYHLIPRGDTRKDVGPLDYHFWVDWGEDALQYPEWSIPKDGGKTIYVASDTHLDNGYRVNKARKFDYVFFNQAAAIKQFKHYGASFWLPHAVEPLAYPYINTIKKYDVSFIGHMQNDEPNCNGMSRVQALDQLFKKFPNFYYGSRHPAFPGKNLFEDAAHHFAESKIVFNISIRDDINMRVFESMASGSLLVTNEVPTLKKLFKDGVHLVTYSSYKEMIDKVQYYLKHEKEREKIAEAGRKEVLAKHTYKHRVETIFKSMGVVIK